MATSIATPHIAPEVIRQNRFSGILLTVFYALLATILGAYLVLAIGQHPHSHVAKEPATQHASNTR